MNAKSLNQKFDYVLISFCLVVMAWAARQLWFVPLDLTESNNQTPLAELAAKNQEVVWKQGESLAWHQGNIGEEFFQGDEIFTYEGASATLALAKLGTVTLEPKTLLKLEESEDGLSGINIEKGSITLSLKADQSLFLKTAGKTLRLKNSPTKSQIKIVREGKLPSVTVMEGEIELADESSQREQEDGHASSIVLKSDQQFNIEIADQATTKPDPMPLEPEIIYSSAPQLANIETQFEANKAPLSLSLPLSWPQMTIAPNATLAEQQFFVLVKQADGKTLNRIALSPSDDTLEMTLPAPSNTSLELEELRQGKIFQSRKLGDVTFVSPAPLEQVQLVSPNHRADLYQQDKVLVLSWHALPRASSYEIEVTSSKGEVQKNHSTSNSFKVNLDSAQSLRWRVRANRQSELVDINGDWSQERVLHFFPLGALAKSPKEGMRLELKTPDEKINLAWAATASEDIQNYLVEIADGPDFSKIIKSFETDQTRLGFTLGKSGVFYWRTKVRSQNGQISYSIPVQVEIIPGKAPPPPVIPKIKKIKIKPVTINSTFWERLSCQLLSCAQANEPSELPQIRLEWDEVPEARGYRVEIYQDKKQKVLVYKSDVKKNELFWNPPKAGIYYWRLASLDPWNRPLLFSPLAQLVLELEIDQETNKETAPRVSQKIPAESVTAEQLADTLERLKTYSKNSELFLGKMRLAFMAGSNSWNEESSQHRVDYSGPQVSTLQFSYSPAFFLRPESRFTYSLGAENQASEIDSNKEFRRRQLYAEAGWRLGDIIVHTLSGIVGQELQTTFPLSVPSNPNSGLTSQEETELLLGFQYRGTKSFEVKDYLTWQARYSRGVLSGFSLGGHYGFEFEDWNLELGLFYQSLSRDLRQTQLSSGGVSVGLVF